MERSLTGTAKIELKLQNGIQVFSASEVAHLLNEIRIYQHILRTNTKGTEELNRTRNKRDQLAKKLELALVEIKQLKKGNE